MRVLVTGAAGQLGRALQRRAPAHCTVLALPRAQLELTGNGLGARLRRLRPDCVINAAAYTDVDGAEGEARVAFAVNAEGAERLAAAAARVDAGFIHVSTDFVFDGQASHPYRPSDPGKPINAYGRSKLAGEERVLARYPQRAMVVRTAWLYAADGRNFLTTMLRLMSERDELRVVNDQIGTPTAVDSLAGALWGLVERPTSAGVTHWTNAGAASWFEFARVIAEQAQAHGLLERPPRIVPIAAAELDRPAPRPAYSVLDTSALAAHLGCQPRHWRDELTRVLDARVCSEA